MKEFVAASDEEKKVVFSKIEDEVEKLKDSTARYFISGCSIVMFIYNLRICLGRGKERYII